MRHRIVHGATIDIPSVEEIQAAVRQTGPQITRVRATETILLDANGNGQDEVYKVPLGYDFNVRRVSLNLSTASDPSTGNVALNVAGKYVAYLRSGTWIEYAVPLSPNAIAQVPGAQNWGDQQGPYLRNGEVFEVKAVGLTAAAVLTVILEGVLRRPALGEDR